MPMQVHESFSPSLAFDVESQMSLGTVNKDRFVVTISETTLRLS